MKGVMDLVPSFSLIQDYFLFCVLHVLFHIVKANWMLISELDSTAYVWVTGWYHLLFRNRLFCLLCESTPGSLFSRPHFEVWPILQAELNVIHGLATWEFHEGGENPGWGNLSDLFHYVNIGVGGERVKKVENFFSFLNLWTAKLVNNDIFLWSNSIWNSIFSSNLKFHFRLFFNLQ